MTVEVSRRSILIGGMAVLATALPVPAMALRLRALDSNSDKLNEGEKSMATITTKDGTQIFYKDWGPKDAQPIVFHHGWPSVVGRLGHADAFFPCQRLSRCRA